MFLQSLNDPGQGLEYMQQFFLNATVSFSVIILLAAGATLRYSSSTAGLSRSHGADGA